MARIKIITKIHAPIERCFDLSRSIDFHTYSTSSTGESAISGITRGLIGMGEKVTWRAKHFGIRQTLTSQITAFDSPTHFRDSMASGAFKRFDHDHYFEYKGDYTLMTDIFDFESPCGFLGKAFDAVILSRYLKRFLTTRNNCIKETAESDQWQQFLPEDISINF